VRQSIDALNRDQVDPARQLFRRDDAVDRMHRDASQLIIEGLEKDPSAARRLASDLLVARHFERIADNACKIGEKTIYALTGQRRSEYLPRHPYRPYTLEAPRRDGKPADDVGPPKTRPGNTKAP
ncbi:MAG: phosphate uptake regulator PhoU, partial [Thermoplasmata archaeon]